MIGKIVVVSLPAGWNRIVLQCPCLIEAFSVDWWAERFLLSCANEENAEDDVLDEK